MRGRRGPRVRGDARALGGAGGCAITQARQRQPSKVMGRRYSAIWLKGGRRVPVPFMSDALRRRTP